MARTVGVVFGRLKFDSETETPPILNEIRWRLFISWVQMLYLEKNKGSPGRPNHSFMWQSTIYGKGRSEGGWPKSMVLRCSTQKFSELSRRHGVSHESPVQIWTALRNLVSILPGVKRRYCARRCLHHPKGIENNKKQMKNCNVFCQRQRFELSKMVRSTFFCLRNPAAQRAFGREVGRNLWFWGAQPRDSLNWVDATAFPTSHRFKSERRCEIWS